MKLLRRNIAFFFSKNNQNAATSQFKIKLRNILKLYRYSLGPSKIYFFNFAMFIFFLIYFTYIFVAFYIICYLFFLYIFKEERKINDDEDVTEV